MTDFTLERIAIPAHLDDPDGADFIGADFIGAMKAANIRSLQSTAPEHPSIITFNAEENQHMLEVNEAVGFSAIGYEGAWKKILAPS